ncbi:hypothetical protein KIPB_012041 [Kipferlia bialata]|uniref:Uncharacterized protein n=1 Tax=Kipferlia bialata TaxID=797122 RepID=A0A391NQZ4_9EUKA|nr:hypothetical protein KIPB_012041 [Kipferlia bialata]|eukprot:g12041.t1
MHPWMGALPATTGGMGSGGAMGGVGGMGSGVPVMDVGYGGPSAGGLEGLDHLGALGPDASPPMFSRSFPSFSQPSLGAHSTYSARPDPVSNVGPPITVDLLAPPRPNPPPVPMYGNTQTAGPRQVVTTTKQNRQSPQFIQSISLSLSLSLSVSSFP